MRIDCGVELAIICRLGLLIRLLPTVLLLLSRWLRFCLLAVVVVVIIVVAVCEALSLDGFSGAFKALVTGAVGELLLLLLLLLLPPPQRAFVTRSMTLVFPLDEDPVPVPVLEPLL